MKSEVQVRLGLRVAGARHARGFTQEQLAERCGMTVKAISAIERGLVNVPLMTLADIAKAIGVTISELALGIDGGLPREVRTLERLLAGRPRQEQAAIVKVLTAMFDLVQESNGGSGEEK
jgi:transcriptional regulator with XRE-family HTH domain